ncbi:hypothetical protein BLAT2472_80242 [Burkholderia latens]
MHVASHACCNAEHGACVLRFHHCRRALESKGFLYAVAQRARRLYDEAIFKAADGAAQSIGRQWMRSVGSGQALNGRLARTAKRGIPASEEAPTGTDCEAWGLGKR